MLSLGLALQHSCPSSELPAVTRTTQWGKPGSEFEGCRTIWWGNSDCPSLQGFSNTSLLFGEFGEVVMGFLFVYIPSNFLLMVIWKNPVGRIWGKLQTSWASESLGLLQKAKRTENISQWDCTRWEGWRWWKVTEVIISQGRRNCWDAQTQISMEHSAEVNFAADHFPWRTQNPSELEISNCTGILAVKLI